MKNNTPGNYTHIKGWGIDANPENDPTYPIKKRTDEEQRGYSWERPQQQPADVEILHSNERPNLSATFGTSTPPAGLSGAIRRFAFKYSESSYAHWVPLVVADRVDVVQGIIRDLANGIVPNIFAELGWKADMKYNKKGLVKKVVVTALITTAVVALMCRKTESKKTLLKA